MPSQVCSGATLRCSFGTIPSQLTVTPEKRCNTMQKPAATVMDFMPNKNIVSFGMCSAPTNPQVVAAMGSPVPCVPVTTSPWTPGSPTVKIGQLVALTATSTCMCSWLGIISVEQPGQQSVNAQ